MLRGKSHVKCSYHNNNKRAIKAQKYIENIVFHIDKWKKQVGKGYISYDSNNMTFWENYRDSKNISGCQGLEHRGFLGQWNYPEW